MRTLAHDAVLWRNFGLWYWGCFIAALVWRFYLGLGLSQLGQPPVLDGRDDLVLWFLADWGLVQVFAQNPVLGLVWDAGLSLLALGGLWAAWQRKNQLQACLALALALGFAYYLLIQQSYPTLTIKRYLGLLFLPWYLVFRQSKSRYLVWEGLRYYLLYVFASAALWKIFRGSVWEWGHFSATLKAQHIAHWSGDMGYFWQPLHRFLIEHSLLAQSLFWAGTALQLSFLGGFFSKRGDRFLALGLVLFVLLDYVLMRINYVELLVFLPLLWYKTALGNNIKS